MDQIWTDLLNFINQLVSPDWGALVGLVPLSLAALVGLYVVWIVWRFARAAPTRRGRRRLTPRPPPGVHAGEQSWSPVLGAIGMFLLLAGLVFKGPVIAAGVLFLALALLYWLREAMREYDHVDHPPTALMVVPGPPPPGIHVPGPSFRPILASISLAALFYGLVFGGWLIVAGVLMLAISLVQWLTDARREYKGILVADVTGHLPPDPRPGYPRGTLALFAILFVGAIVLQAGILPPRSAVGGTTPGASGPSPSAGASGQPGGSGGPVGSADVTITAANLQFEGGPGAQHEAPADKPFTIRFQNNDASIPHNVAIRDGGASGPDIWKGEIITGPATKDYQVTPLHAGTYTFVCNVHPTMTGTLVVK